jgi:Ca2+-binding EF-hand superfamily protein
MKPILRNLALGATVLALTVTVIGGSPNFAAFAQTTSPSASAPLPEGTIKALQEALNTQGIAVTANGVLDDETRAAIRQYQSQHHLPVTGEPDKATLDKLGVGGQASELPGGSQANGEAPSGQATGGMPGMMGMMTPEMMQMMQRMMGQGGMGGMMGGMMGQGGMGGMEGNRGPRMGMMGHGGMMMRVMFSVMDTDGDGALSLDEVQEAHARIFKHVDADNDGRVTLEEMQAFMRGTPLPARQMPMRQGMPMERAPSASAQAYMDAMQTMMAGMEAMEKTGEPGADFASMMIPHHQSAIDMAEAYLEHGDDPELTNLANEIIAAQQKEIEFLQNWLNERR